MSDLFATAAPVAYAQVAVERAIDRFPGGLTYAIPGDLADLAPGERVIVPLGRGDRPTPGYIVDVSAEPGRHGGTVKMISRRDDAGIRLPMELVDLAQWISSYYCTPIGMTLNAILPAAVKRNVGSVTHVMIDIATPDDDDEVTPPKRSAQQRTVLDTLRELPPNERPIEIRELAGRAGIRTVGPIKRLLDGGAVVSSRRSLVAASWAGPPPEDSGPHALTADQSRIVDGVGAALETGFSAHLLYGVTGSGKTEVYLRLIARTVEAGRVAVLLVPEISLTPQTGGRLLARFPDVPVAILHSALTAAQRHQQWALAAAGTARIIIGARSAVFAPVPTGELGLIIVDEEHDGSYKQDQAPRYHARDVAVRRAQQANCPVLLGSATPSLESWHNASVRGLYRRHDLPSRVPGMRLPQVRIVDLAAQRRDSPGGGSRLLGPVLEAALRSTLDAGHQALLLLNRRGYANYIACADGRCGWAATCDDCDVSLVYHKDRHLPRGGYVQCHHCEREQRLPAVCPDCGGRITTLGIGTRRIEEALGNAFPEFAESSLFARVDSDTIRSPRDLHEILGRFGSGELRVLVGTQMIAKGLDYPGVRLVGVVNADTAINMPDFRATEHTFQLVSQVAGRCGRSTDPTSLGLVVVQSFHPDNHAIQLAARHDFPTFAQQELADRHACGLPPFARMARIVVRHEDAIAGRDAAATVAERLQTIATGGVEVRGPAPCPIARIAGRFRHEVELLAPDAATLQRTLTDARNHGWIRPGAAMAIDVDPLSLL